MPKLFTHPLTHKMQCLYEAKNSFPLLACKIDWCHQMSSEPLQITNEDERRFTIRLLRKYENYGDDDRLTYEHDEPSLEFFDASGFDSEEEQQIMGYFTGIRCIISELFVEVHERSAAFREHLSIWNISEESIFFIKIWLLQQLSEEEKGFINMLPAFPYLKTTINTDKIYDARSIESIMQEIRTESLTEESIVPLSTDEETQHHRVDFVQQELEEAIRALDLAEAAETRWKEGDIELRLRILSAKRQTLKAIALLNKQLNDWFDPG